MKEENLTIDQECIFHHECIIRLYICNLSLSGVRKLLVINRRTK